jgi:hypothetical protein
LQPISDRVKKLIVEVIRPNACQSNTETFRGELSMDEVQKIYKEFKPQIMAIFMHYAIEEPPSPGVPTVRTVDGWADLVADDERRKARHKKK